ncbi:MAG: hypothetical protein J6W95_06970 [Bacteroidales bacterium]|nr:hypothetical protein [Bacteroidales bacterium]
MKKIFFMMAFVAIGLAATAQTLNVQSAAQDMRRGYLNKAKAAIDKACVHDATKNDAKTWYYAGLIYTQIGGEQSNPKSKFKDLDPDWLTKAKDAAFRCKELDTDKEYADKINEVFSYVANVYLNMSLAAINAQQWDNCMALCEQAIQIFNESGNKKFVGEAYLMAGRAAMNAQNNEAIQKYFKPLVRMRTKENLVYKTLFKMYLSEKDTNAALKLAQNYTKAAPEDYNANMMMAEAYMLMGDMEKGNEEIQKALKVAEGNTQVHAQLLAAAGATMESAKNFAGAEASYKQSIAEEPNQFLANYGLGKMLYNHGIDKLEAVNALPLEDEEGATRLTNECLDLWRQAIPYFNNAIAYIDKLDAETQSYNRSNLFGCLGALKNVYARLEMYDELKVVNARMDALQAAAAQH